MPPLSFASVGKTGFMCRLKHAQIFWFPKLLYTLNCVKVLSGAIYINDSVNMAGQMVEERHCEETTPPSAVWGCNVEVCATCQHATTANS